MDFLKFAGKPPERILKMAGTISNKMWISSSSAFQGMDIVQGGGGHRLQEVVQQVRLRRLQRGQQVCQGLRLEHVQLPVVRLAGPPVRLQLPPGRGMRPGGRGVPQYRRGPQLGPRPLENPPGSFVPEQEEGREGSAGVGTGDEDYVLPLQGKGVCAPVFMFPFSDGSWT